MKKVFALLILCLIVSGCEKAPEKDAFDLHGALGGVAAEGFARVIEPRNFQFPDDHRVHPEFRSEWWYVTGNLKTTQGRHFGYQLTFFRNAISPDKPESGSGWATNQVWMAHIALTDVQQEKHYHDQRLARGAAGLAGQADQPFRVWLEDWQLSGAKNGDFPWEIAVSTADFSLELQLTPQKPVVLQGERGLSQKSSAVGNASYYYSFTRLQAQGKVTLTTGDGEQRTMPVQGYSWLDREWSTSALGEDQAGWDWFSLQLHEGHDLMFYRMRSKSGATDRHSAGKWVDANGETQALDYQQVELKPVRYWSVGERKYPVVWEMRIPELDKHWRIEALLDDQLMETGITYWEGAVKIININNDEPLGYGYLEMSGY
ncbi:MAG: lipocalin-like domain-containing protein [Thiolinea sp.]